MRQSIFSAIAAACLATLLALAAANARAAEKQMETRTIEYKEGDATLEGELVFTMDAPGAGRPRRGILVFHQWKGLSDHERSAAWALAHDGYIVFAADIYGKGIRPTTPQEAGKLAGQYKSDRALLRRRAAAALKTLQEIKGKDGKPLVDPKRVGAIGYCFGGTTVLEMARDGQDLVSVVSFHGGLDAPVPAKKGEIKSKVLVLHGADDPHVPPAQVQAFEEEMRACGADWQLVAFGGAVHSFTDKKAGSDNSKGAAYNESADKRSWEMMNDFFSETLAPAR